MKTARLKLTALSLLLLAPFFLIAGVDDDARRIFDDLVRAIGDRKTEPKLEIRKADIIAQYMPNSNRIVISESFLKFAEEQPHTLEILALVLGHELAHHFEDHGSRIEKSYSPDSNQENTYHDKKLELEKEADLFAIYFAYMAGYPITHLGKHFLKELYEEFKIGKSIHYPSLEERTIIYEQARNEIEKLIHQFEAGKLLLLVGYPESAAFCFENIAEQFWSPEVWNNTGVAYFFSALPYFPKEHLAASVSFPIELADNLLKDKIKGQERSMTLREEEATIFRINLLHRAKESFEKSLIYDPYSFSALNNLFIVQLLLAVEDGKSWYEGNSYMFMSRQSFKRLEFFHETKAGKKAQFLILEGLLKTFIQDEKKAKELYSQAIEEFDHPSAKINLAVLNGEPIDLRDNDAYCPDKMLFGIDLISMRKTAATEKKKILLDSIASKPATLVESWPNEVTLKEHKLDGGIAYQVTLDLFKDESNVIEQFLFLKTREGYVDAGGDDIRIGSSRVSLEDKYGSPDNVYYSEKQTYYYYPLCGLIFGIKNDKVSTMVTFTNNY